MCSGLKRWMKMQLCSFFVSRVYRAYHTQQYLQYLSTSLALTGILLEWFRSPLFAHRDVLQAHFLASQGNRAAGVCKRQTKAEEGSLNTLTFQRDVEIEKKRLAGQELTGFYPLFIWDCNVLMQSKVLVITSSPCVRSDLHAEQPSSKSDAWLWQFSTKYLRGLSTAMRGAQWVMQFNPRGGGSKWRRQEFSKAISSLLAASSPLSVS